MVRLLLLQGMIQTHRLHLHYSGVVDDVEDRMTLKPSSNCMMTKPHQMRKTMRMKLYWMKQLLLNRLYSMMKTILISLVVLVPVVVAAVAAYDFVSYSPIAILRSYFGYCC